MPGDKSGLKLEAVLSRSLGLANAREWLEAVSVPRQRSCIVTRCLHVMTSQAVQDDAWPERVVVEVLASVTSVGPVEANGANYVRECRNRCGRSAVNQQPQAAILLI